MNKVPEYNVGVKKPGQIAVINDTLLWVVQVFLTQTLLALLEFQKLACMTRKKSQVQLL